MKYIAILLFIMLCSCASHKQSSSNINSWGDSCYNGFSKHLSQIVSKEAENCGFVKEGSTAHEVAVVSKCAKLKTEKGVPFIFGYSSTEDDALTCKVVAKDVKSKIWSVYTSNGAGENLPVLIISECKKLEFNAQSKNISEVATLNGCEVNSDLFNKILGF